MNPGATEREGILEIPRVTAADAGRYRCVVQSSGGSNEGYAIVEVNGKSKIITFVLFKLLQNK